MKSTTKFFVFVLFASFLPASMEGAETRELAAMDMALMSMFYEEKELVVTPTRSPKPLAQVAENMVVITAKEIEDMRARNLSEVLRRVTGVLVLFDGEDYGSMGQVSIQGAPSEQILFLVDGVPWNPLSDSIARMSTIPVHAIDRIEIIKGPASSAWGSSLGGVVNILMKSGPGAGAGGTIGASVGKSSSHDLYTDFSGGGDGFRYYLFAGRQGSAGLDAKRQYDFNSIFSKISFDAGDNATVTFSAGYSKPRFHEESLNNGFTFDIPIPTLWINGRLDTSLTEFLSISVDAYHLEQDASATLDFVDSSRNPIGFSLTSTEKNETNGLRGKLTWEGTFHTLVAGAETRQGELTNNVPEEADIEEWAVYLNDTLVLGRWSFTPGIRFDALETAENVFSPSFGMTFRAATHTLFRGYLGRGFFAPPPGRFFTGSTVGLMANTGLKPETVLAVTGGVESVLFDLLRAKATGFYFKQKDSLLFSGTTAQNGDDIETVGAEVDLETKPVWNLSFVTGLSYVDRSPENDPTNFIQKIWNLGIVYDDLKTWRAELFGHYLRPDYEPTNFANRDTRHYDDMIWDFNIARRFRSSSDVATEIFAVVRNILGGDQYHTETFKNPGVWAEAGVRLTY